MGPRPQHILVVDDSQDMRQMWRVWLTYWGFSVDEAANGAEAIRQARLRRPDLVLMDLWMPVVDGFTATARLKAEPATADVPVLALSAGVFPPTPDRAKGAGCDAFIEKPVDPDDLLEHLRQAFRGLRKPASTAGPG